MTPRGSGLLSVIVPVLNEEDNIPELVRRLKAALDDGLPFDIIFVDDGSTDRTWRLLTSLHAEDPRIKSVRLARTFGHQAAISAGLRAATGDAVVVMDVLNAMPERPRFVRGMRAWAGFRQSGVPCDRGDRFAGRTKHTYRMLVRLALDGFFGFSNKPLQLASALGIAVSGASFALALALVFLRLAAGVPLPGTTALLVAVLFLGGVQLICLGILGEYVGRIYDEVRARPPFVVAAIVGETRLPPTAGEPQI